MSTESTEVQTEHPSHDASVAVQPVVNRLTPAQMRTLKTAVRDGVIIFGGIDETPNVRIDVVKRLLRAGLLKFKAPHSSNETSSWEPTDLGRQIAG